MDDLPFDAETRARLILHLISGIGPKLTIALLERFETAEKVLKCTANDLRTIPHIGGKTAQQLIDSFAEVNVEEELKRVKEEQVTLFYHGARDYPKGVAEIPSPPMILYVQGEIKEEDRRSIAIVGSRKCTAYGKRITERLAGDLVRAGYTIVSGLARGIDGAAHRAALDAGGRTLAVLAGGLGKLYPPEHKQLARDVVQNGALISEMPMAMVPLPDMFPRRNRIISGLSRGVIIVEAAQRSGALVTARHALEQGRDVFAVPGPIDSEASEGPNELIRKGAVLIRSAEDVLEHYQELDAHHPLPSAAHPAKKTEGEVANLFKEFTPSTLSAEQKRIWEVLDKQGVSVDDVVQKTELGITAVNTELMMMELAGHIRRLPGNRFVRR